VILLIHCVCGPCSLTLGSLHLAQDTEFGLLVFIGFFFFAAINPGTGKFVKDEEEVEE